MGYAVEVLKAKRAGTPIKFKGYCASACTLYLHLPSSQLCVYKDASFHFHAPFMQADGKPTPKIRDYMMNMYPNWVRSWINANGGLTSKMIRMDYNTIRKHIKECK